MKIPGDYRLTSFWPLAAALALVASMAGKSAAADDLAQEAASAKSQFAVEAGKLAAWCGEKRLDRAARETLALAEASGPNVIRLPFLPRQIGSSADPSVGDLAEWHRRLAKLRRQQADELFNLAQHFGRRHEPWQGYRFVLDALSLDPDHEAARRALGYVKFQSEWHTPYEVRMIRGGMVWSEKFGWLEKSSVARYERGERLCGSTWTDAATDAALHADISSGWEIETEHYRIRTNDSIESAVALGAKLETLNRAWRELFIGYFSSAAEVEALLSGKRPSEIAAPRMEVVYFHNQEQYHRAVKAQVSMGYYSPENRAAYFYAGGENSERTMYHEATHQLFQESRPTSDNLGKKANFWLIEGIALYMETFRREGDFYLLGGLHDVRMDAARQHLEANDFVVPFDKLVHMGMQDIQNSPDIAKLYSQFAAMTSFLMHDDGGRYREALVSCLRDVYDGNQEPDLLSRATGADYGELDRQYREYMKTK